jgi:hypothetical protein
VQSLIRQAFNERFVGHSKLFLSSNAFFTRGRRVKFLRILLFHSEIGCCAVHYFGFAASGGPAAKCPSGMIDDAAEPWAGAEGARTS